MAKAFTDWKVLPHGPLRKLTENLWWVEGSLPGMSLKRVMTGCAWETGVCFPQRHRARGERHERHRELGQPPFLIVPSVFIASTADLQAPYPDLRLYGPRGGRAK